MVEQDSFVWVWIGDPDRADPAAIPRAPWLADPRLDAVVRGMEPLDARYGLLVDNLLDLSHETYLHGGYIGTPEVAETPITTEVDEDAGIVHVSRHMDDAECPPFYARSTGIEGRITRWQDIEYHPPCLYLLHSRIAPAGRLPAGRTASDRERLPRRDRVRHHPVDRAHHLRLLGGGAGLRDRRRGGHRVPARQQPHRGHAGRDALNILEQVIATEPDGYQELSINIDTGGLAARRMLARLVGTGTVGAAR